MPFWRRKESKFVSYHYSKTFGTSPKLLSKEKPGGYWNREDSLLKIQFIVP